jgi:hypothetical protein
MKVVRRLVFETRNARFTIEVTARADGRAFEAKYSGTSPKFAPAVRPGSSTPMMSEIGSGTLTGADLEKLITLAKAAIEEIDGPIERVVD